MSKSRREEKTEYIKKIPFKYNYKQFQDWCSDNDQLRNKTIDSLVDICGNLGKKERSFHNQAKKMKQNYPEVRYAVYLIEDKGYEKQCIICENYTLSYDYANMLRFKNNLHSKGTKLLRDVLNDAFFIEFDKLANLNKESITKPIKNIHVDLCAINHSPRRRQLNFIELKKYNDNSPNHEDVTREQYLLLSFVRHIKRTLENNIFKQRIYKINTELIVFVPDNDKDLFKRLEAEQPHPVTFFVPI